MEAGLKWAIGKKRREKCDFLGGEVRCSPETDSVLNGNTTEVVSRLAETEASVTMGGVRSSCRLRQI